MKSYIDRGDCLEFSGAFIPKMPGNRDYDLALSEVGGGLAEIVDPEPVEKTILQAQAEGEAYLASFGIGDNEQKLITAIAAITQDAEMKGKCEALLQWVLQIYVAAKTDPANFQAANFGPAPYTISDFLG